ncbi:hypothetical protein QQS21_005547 [Conoideocrella luteorostrata]|uniref:Uncharacterized protein n=1 Tax=Conoideocrella luteorostrata TaxID=1105319 RepID=A0AAJ0FTR5_9HYPO|nr:hypothetical protein QQS21_005547 [Conoideocrella luteorostrata]
MGEIADFQHKFSVTSQEKDARRFDVTVDDALIVEVYKSRRDMIKPSLVITLQGPLVRPVGLEDFPQVAIHPVCIYVAVRRAQVAQCGSVFPSVRGSGCIHSVHLRGKNMMVFKVMRSHSEDILTEVKKKLLVIDSDGVFYDNRDIQPDLEHMHDDGATHRQTETAEILVDPSSSNLAA